jgi:hypothetical protein
VFSLLMVKEPKRTPPDRWSSTKVGGAAKSQTAAMRDRLQNPQFFDCFIVNKVASEGVLVGTFRGLKLHSPRGAVTCLSCRQYGVVGRYAVDVQA